MKKFLYSRSKKNKGFKFNRLNYGVISLKSISSGYLSEKHKEEINQILKRNIKNFKVNIVFNRIFTKKSLETRMGGGKGLIQEKLYFIKSGSILLEFHNISLFKALFISKIINNKISVKLKLVCF